MAAGLKAAIAGALFFLLPLPAATAGTLSVLGRDEWVTVAHVIDGDTFVTRDHRKVRLLGINAPEVMHDDEPGEPLGETAKAHLRDWIEGKRVRLAFDRERRDQYGRLLARVECEGRWINARLLDEGLAHVYTFAPNFRWAQALLAHERPTREQGLGIWHTSRFRILDANAVRREHIGQFRLVRGRVEHAQSWTFRLGRLQISVPKRHRAWFGRGLRLRDGQQVLVRGKIRVSSRGARFLALHTPFDLEVLQ